MMSAYQFLGVSEEASLKDIARAYHRKARLYHPDVGGKLEDFIQLKKAYEILVNPNTRQYLGDFPGFLAKAQN